MKSLAAVAVAASLASPLVATPADAQGYSGLSAGQGYGQGHVGQTYSSGYGQSCGQNCGDDRYDRNRRQYNSYNGQRDAPGDYRCDAYWDANRTDCNAAWRDQRPRRPAHRRSYGGQAVYQGEYGRPDVVYSGRGYSHGGRYSDPYGHDHSGYGQYGRDAQRINWCCAEYRSYDPATGYYTAYSGEHVYCG